MENKMRQQDILCWLVNKKKACGSFFKLHEKRCFTIFTLSQSNDRLYFYEGPHNFYTFLNTQDRNI